MGARATVAALCGAALCVLAARPALGGATGASAPPPSPTHLVRPEPLRPQLRSVTIRRFDVHHGRLSLFTTEVKRYDKAGRLRSSLTYKGGTRRRRGPLWIAVRHSYDKSGRLSRTLYREPRSGRRIDTRYRYRVDARGRVVRRESRHGTTTYVETVTYQPGGGYEVSGAPPGVTRYQSYARYDKRGRRTRSCSVTQCEMISYDAHGGISRVRVHPRQGRPLGHHWFRSYTRRYDKRGLAVEITLGNLQRLRRYNKRGDVVAETRRALGKRIGRTRWHYVYR